MAGLIEKIDNFSFFRLIGAWVVLIVLMIILMLIHPLLSTFIGVPLWIAMDIFTAAWIVVKIGYLVVGRDKTD